MKQQQQIIVECTRLGSLSVASVIRAPGEQHTSLESVSGWQTGASVPSHRLVQEVLPLGTPSAGRSATWPCPRPRR